MDLWANWLSHSPHKRDNHGSSPCGSTSITPKICRFESYREYQIHSPNSSVRERILGKNEVDSLILSWGTT